MAVPGTLSVTLNVHEAPGASVPPPNVSNVSPAVPMRLLPVPQILLRGRVDPPSGAVTTPSIHVVTALAGVAMVVPAGRLSVNARSLTGDELPLVMVKVRVAVLPGPIVAG